MSKPRIEETVKHLECLKNQDPDLAKREANCHLCDAIRTSLLRLDVLEKALGEWENELWLLRTLDYPLVNLVGLIDRILTSVRGSDEQVRPQKTQDRP